MNRSKTQPMIRLLVLVLMAYAFFTLLSVGGMLGEARRTLEESRLRAEELRREIAALQYDIDHAAEAEYIERLAREKLELVMPDETVIHYVGD